MANRPAICSPRVPDEQPGALPQLIPAQTNVAGSRSAKYFRVSDASAPMPGAEVEIVDLVDFTDRSGLDLPPDLR